jgi:renalase
MTDPARLPPLPTQLNRRVGLPASAQRPRIAVVGGGLAGLMAACTLQDHGLRVTLFDKSRGVGGRMATRRAAGLTFDHGAQYFTARDDGFRRLVGSWCECGLVAPWPSLVGVLEDGRTHEAEPVTLRYVAVPGMNALGKYLAADLEVVRDTAIMRLERAAGTWVLVDSSGGRTDGFDRVVVAAPAPQAVPLLRDVSDPLAAAAAGVVYAPAWAVMLVPDDPLPVAWDALRFRDGPLAWACHDGSKPGRHGNAWVLHATPTWSAAHREDAPDDVADTLVAAFRDRLGLDTGTLLHRDAHRWLYARVENPLRVGALWDAEAGVGACGDWCADARVEDACLSGQAVAARLLAAPG